MFAVEFVEAVVQLVVLLGKLPVLIVALEQQLFYFLRICGIHKPPLL